MSSFLTSPDVYSTATSRKKNMTQSPTSKDLTKDGTMEKEKMNKKKIRMVCILSPAINIKSNTAEFIEEGINHS